MRLVGFHYNFTAPKPSSVLGNLRIGDVRYRGRVGTGSSRTVARGARDVWIIPSIRLRAEQASFPSLTRRQGKISPHRAETSIAASVLWRKSSPLRSALRRDLDLERGVLSNSGLFDETWYCQQAGLGALDDPVGHYLISGWQAGLEPNASFPGTFLLPYFASAGFDGPPAITWLILKSAGWPMHETQEKVEAWAATIRAAELFDEASYTVRARLTATGLDPATHYALVGERLGIAPSAAFDPAYYLELNPDVGAGAVNLLLHYVNNGRTEGRHAHPATPTSASSFNRFDPGKENVLLVIHDGSRTGAPILGWNIGTHLARIYNLFTVFIGDGELIRDFAEISVEVHGPFCAADHRGSLHPVEIEYSVRNLLEARKFRYALINSIESRVMIQPCIRHFIPTLLLMHEFAAYSSGDSFSALDWATEVVFPAAIVARNAEECYPNLSRRPVRILVQGASLLPAAREPLPQAQTEVIRRLRCQREIEETFVVLGGGSVQIRKGVDLFLGVAAAVQRGDGRRPVHFVWVGHGFRPKEDLLYSAYLQEQLKRSGLGAHVTFLDAVADLEPVYQISDAFLLSSRLDPLPNIAIDAALRGIPVVCFKNASGMADLLQGNPETAKCVVEHLDAEAAAHVIVELANHEPSRTLVSAATRRFAQAIFDMESYVASLDILGSAAARRVAQQEIDARTLLSDFSFDQDSFLGPNGGVESRQQTIARYLAIAGARGADEPAGELGYRRPSPGFNPRIYRAANPATLLDGVDSLADFVRRGKPKGPWQAPVLRPDDSGFLDFQPSGKLRVAIQAHFFYPELATDFLARIGLNRASCDLLVSTNDSAKAQYLTRTMSVYAAGEVKVRIVPNRGRDISPLLTAFADDLLGYELIGHVHGKRSLWSDDNVGEVWRKFLWENLIGGQYPMMDRIVGQFEQEAQLGLVFPSDPHPVGWCENRILATSLAKRMGFEGPLPDALDFPVGTMFWMRRDALRPLIALALDWDDYPIEPLPYDGTIQHALERLPPIAAQLAGFGYSVTHVPGVFR